MVNAVYLLSRNVMNPGLRKHLVVKMSSFPGKKKNGKWNIFSGSVDNLKLLV